MKTENYSGLQNISQNLFIFPNIENWDPTHLWLFYAIGFYTNIYLYLKYLYETEVNREPENIIKFK